MVSAGSSRKLILVVEDDRDIRESLCEVLQSEGHEVLSAVDGKDALLQLEKLSEPPKLVLLDLMMPVMDGWQFLTEFRNLPGSSGTPVYILSAALHRASDMDVSGYLKKPVELAQLLELVHAHLS